MSKIRFKEMIGIMCFAMFLFGIVVVVYTATLTTEFTIAALDSSQTSFNTKDSFVAFLDNFIVTSNKNKTAKDQQDQDAQDKIKKTVMTTGGPITLSNAPMKSSKQETFEDDEKTTYIKVTDTREDGTSRTFFMYSQGQSNYYKGKQIYVTVRNKNGGGAKYGKSCCSFNTQRNAYSALVNRPVSVSEFAEIIGCPLEKRSGGGYIVNLQPKYSDIWPGTSADSVYVKVHNMYKLWEGLGFKTQYYGNNGITGENLRKMLDKGAIVIVHKGSFSAPSFAYTSSNGAHYFAIRAYKKENGKYYYALSDNAPTHGGNQWGTENEVLGLAKSHGTNFMLGVFPKEEMIKKK